MNIRTFSVVVGALIVMGAAKAQTVWVSEDDGNIGQLNVLTGDYTLVNSSSFLVLGGLGYGKGGVLYGMATDGNLYTVDSAGDQIPVGPTGLQYGNSWGMGGGPDGTLYASTFGNLSTLNQATGAGTIIGSYGFDTQADPALDAAGNLYLNDSFTNQLYSINKTTGASTLIGTMNAASEVNIMVFTGGVMYALDVQGDIYSVDTSDAALTLVSNYSDSTGHRLQESAASTFAAVPEPKSFAILGVGALAFLRRRKRS